MRSPWTPTGRVDRLVAADRAIRQPVPLSRRIAVLGLHPGVGASTLAASLAATLAARRPGPVLLVDAGGPPADVLALAGLPDAARPALAGAVHPRPSTLAEALGGIPTTASGLACVDLHALARTGAVVPHPDDWLDHIGPTARFLDVVVTDFGARPLEDARAVAALSHVACVVTGPGRQAIEAAARMARHLVADGCPTHLAVTQLRARAPRRAIALLTRDLPAPVVVPHEAGRTPGVPLDSGATSASGRVTAAELAATLLASALAPGAAA